MSIAPDPQAPRWLGVLVLIALVAAVPLCILLALLADQIK